ncbi:MAG: zinc ABC transporter solute-binding protein [Deltaproteobacteria bacterium]|nr:zinc ABC transporter solute-binding protein [Deltaproteobacteria bacterium]
MIKNFILVLMLIIIPIVPKSSMADDRIIVSVTILPQAYFVERIGGDRVDIRVMVPPGASPETFDPTPLQLLNLSRSELYFKIGSPNLEVEIRFQRFLQDHGKHISVVDMSTGVKTLKEDPHIWLSPAVVKAAASNIYRALSSADPANTPYYRENLRSFLTDIDALDRRIKQKLMKKNGYVFMVYHSAWGYFAREYGIRQLAIEEEGRPLNISRIRAMISLARKKGIKTIFIQKGFDEKGASAIAREIGAKVVKVNPLERDWLKNLDDFSAILKVALKP